MIPETAIVNAKNALDLVIKKSRIHLYKPIQIAEVLYRDRVFGDIDLANKETYRVASRKWRDDVSKDLLGSVCTSSVKFQDNIFDDNAVPPDILTILGVENRCLNGGIESYIYKKFIERRYQLANALEYCLKCNKDNFNVKIFIDSFWNEPGLKRSIDKIYEIVTFALFSTIVDFLELKVELSMNRGKIDILHEFEDFAKIVLCIDTNMLIFSQDAAIYRVGITNAADRGLDMYANWGSAIQIKHLSLDSELAQDIIGTISSRKIIIVCKDAEESIILSIMRQTGFSDRIQGIITEKDLIAWYDRSLRGKYSDQIGDSLLSCLVEQIEEEFPFLACLPPYNIK